MDGYLEDGIWGMTFGEWHLEGVVSGMTFGGWHLGDDHSAVPA